MGLPTTPDEAAPAYTDVVHLHPSGSSSGYAAVPQDDIEQNAPEHTHSSPSPAPQQRETFAQTIAGVFKPAPHTHCEACDKQREAREIRENEKHCCTMVASVFMVIAICAMILGIITVTAVARAKRHHD